MKNTISRKTGRAARTAAALLLTIAFVLPVISCGMAGGAPEPLPDPDITGAGNIGGNVPAGQDGTEQDDQDGKEVTTYRVHIPNLLNDREKPSEGYVHDDGGDGDDTYPTPPEPPVRKAGYPDETTLEYHNSHRTAIVKTDSIYAADFREWSDGAPAQLFDGDDGYFTAGNGGGTKLGGDVSDGRLILTFETEPATVISYAFVTGNDSWDYSDRSPRAWTLYASADGSNWITLDEVVESGIEAIDHGYYLFETDGAMRGSYAYYRFEFTETLGNNGVPNIQLNECYLYTDGGTDVPDVPDAPDTPDTPETPETPEDKYETPITGESAEEFHSSHKTATVDISSIKTENFSEWGDGAPERLFDGDDGLFNPDSTVGGNGRGTKLGGSVRDNVMILEFSTDKAVTLEAYAFVTGNDSADYHERSPEAWTLFGSEDGERWFVIDSVSHSGIVAEDHGFFGYTVDAENMRACRYYRFEFTRACASDGISAIQFNECYLYVK